jgi:sugar lactone lactonase YvrE
VSLNHPTDLQVHGSTLLLAAWHDHKLRSYDPDTGMVRVMAGSMPGFRGDGGPVAIALFNQPKAIVYDADSNLYVLDQRNQRIRKIDANGMITTVAGNGTSGLVGDGGAPQGAELSFQTGPNPQPSGALTVDAQGRLYIGDGLNHCIRRVDFSQDLIERVAGTGEDGDFGDGGDPLQAKFGEVRDLEFGPDGRLYFADADHHVVRAIDVERHIIERVAGTGSAPMPGDARIEGRPALETPLHGPTGIAFDPGGQMYIADSGNHRIMKVWQ